MRKDLPGKGRTVFQPKEHDEFPVLLVLERSEVVQAYEKLG